MIPVTKSFLPPIQEYSSIIERIWKNKWLTNHGELTKELNKKLADYLNCDHLILMTNGTLPIQIALNAYGDQGEIVTTPFSYVATTSSIVWEKCIPIFVDIDPEYLTIDETKIEAAITNKTTAILATHVYGNPCNIEVIEKIANKHGIKVIYDGAHCFAVNYKGKSIFNYGDVSTCSFHATKLFHTGEGGALFCSNDEVYHEMFYRHNFGHDGPLKFHGVGINAKMSEFQAAMGLTVLPYVDDIIEERKRVCALYENLLVSSKIKRLRIREGTEWNYSYYPIFFQNEDQLLRVEEKLNEFDIYPRRYFFPSLSTLGYVQSKNDLHVSDRLSKTVLCLPLYPELSNEEVVKITELINQCL